MRNRNINLRGNTLKQSNIKDLVESFAAVWDLPYYRAKDYVNTFCTILQEEFLEAGCVRVPYFGTFKLKRVRSKKFYNRFTKEYFDTEPHYGIKFSPCVELKTKLKEWKVED